MERTNDQGSLQRLLPQKFLLQVAASEVVAEVRFREDFASSGCFRGCCRGPFPRGFCSKLLLQRFLSGSVSQSLLLM